VLTANFLIATAFTGISEANINTPLLKKILLLSIANLNYIKKEVRPLTS
jgi:hypothetical protein